MINKIKRLYGFFVTRHEIHGIYLLNVALHDCGGKGLPA